MASANFEDTFTCGICLETFNEDSRCPRMLSCGHSFCYFCLEKLLFQNPCCPNCRTRIFFRSAASIPVNFSLKNLINIRSQILYFGVLDTEGDPKKPYPSFRQARTSPDRNLPEGYCAEHDASKGIRCIDCDVWVCNKCSTLLHSRCESLVGAKVYKELKRQVFEKAEKGLDERRTVQKRLSESLRRLDEERFALIEEIRRQKLEINKKEIELKDREKQIDEIQSLKSEENKLCDKLKQLQGTVEYSANDAEVTKAIKEIDKLLEKVKQQLIPDGLLHLHLPRTREALATMCLNGPVYAVEDRYEGTRYGKLAVKDRRIWVYSFQTEKPDATLLYYQELLAQFSGSTELPNMAFLQLSPDGGKYDDVEVVIETTGVSPRSRNFILLCSGLKGRSYKGLAMWRHSSNYSCFQSYPGPPPVVEGIRNDDPPQTTLMEAGVYGMSNNNSLFLISLKDDLSVSYSKFGDLVTGIRSLKDLRGKDTTVKECGLVIL